MEIILGILVIIVFALGYFVWAKQQGVKIEHGHLHDLGDNALSTVQNAMETISTATQSAEKTITGLKEGFVEVVSPLSDGVGDLLKSISERIKSKQSEANQLKSQSIALVQEVERLKSRHIDVTEISAQLKLALIKTRHQYKSFSRKNIGFREEGIIFKDKIRDEYMGLITVDYSANIGLDVDRLKFQFIDDRRVAVSGLKNAEIIGLSDMATTVDLSEVRSTKQGSSEKSGGSATINSVGTRCTNELNGHRATVEKEIQSKQSIENMVEPIAKLALAFLRQCLAPAGITVEHDESLSLGTLSFYELCIEINRRNTQQLNDTSAELQMLDQKGLVIEQEILALAEPVRQ